MNRVSALNVSARRQVLSPDGGFGARMAAVPLLGVAFDATLIVAMVLYVTAGGADSGMVPEFIVVLAGLAAARHACPVRRTKLPDPYWAWRCTRVLEPPCLVADLPMPEVVVLSIPGQLSWMCAVPFRRTRIYISGRLVAKAPNRELATVLADELTDLARLARRLVTLRDVPDT